MDLEPGPRARVGRTSMDGLLVKGRISPTPHIRCCQDDRVLKAIHLSTACMFAPFNEQVHVRDDRYGRSGSVAGQPVSRTTRASTR